MKRTQLYLFSVPSFLVVLILSGCSLPAPGVTTTQNVIPEYTAAAQTIIAQLTQAAVTGAPTSQGATVTPGDLATETTTETAPNTDTPTPTETELPAATETPIDTPTPTSLPSDPRAALGEPDFQDTFQSGDNWSLYEDDHVRFRVNDGSLRMVAFNPELWDGFMLSWPEISDFYLEMTGTTKSCSGLDRYGLVSRAVEMDAGYVAYLFGVSCDGRYSLRIWDGEGFTRLVDWTESEHLNKGSNQTNRIGIMMDGDNISLYANGNLMKEFKDDTYDQGKFGMFIGSASTENFTVQIDEIAYWELP